MDLLEIIETLVSNQKYLLDELVRVKQNEDIHYSVLEDSDMFLAQQSLDNIEQVLENQREINEIRGT